MLLWMALYLCTGAAESSENYLMHSKHYGISVVLKDQERSILGALHLPVTYEYKKTSNGIGSVLLKGNDQEFLI